MRQVSACSTFAQCADCGGKAWDVHQVSVASPHLYVEGLQHGAMFSVSHQCFTSQPDLDHFDSEAHALQCALARGVGVKALTADACLDLVRVYSRASAFYHGGVSWLVPNLTVGSVDVEAPSISAALLCYALLIG